jgi:two-component system nitrogen regulation sensor histidine kinase NtrY
MAVTNEALPRVSTNSTVAPAGRDRLRLLRRVGLVATILALISVTVTFLVLTGLTPVAPTTDIITAALAINGVLVAVLVASVAVEVRLLWVARRRGRAGADLHVRIVALFSVIAALPAVLVAILATITLDRGLDRWFEQRTRGIVDNAVAVASAYVEEHGRVLRGDLIALGAEIDRARTMYDYEPVQFDLFLSTQASLRQVPAAFLMKGDGTVVTRTILDLNQTFELPPPQAFARAAEKGPILIAPGDTNQVGGVAKLAAYDDMYLYVTRSMDARVVDYMRLAQEGALEFRDLEASRTGVQIAFALVYVGLALVLLVAAIWLGFGFANRLVTPIRRLITAADQVAHGNLDAKVPIEKSDGDLAHLGETFNAMTDQLHSQREEIISASEQIDRRRRFTEAVLAGATAGVIGIDESGLISLANRSAQLLLAADEGDLVGQHLTDVVPEIAPALQPAGRETADRPRQLQIRLLRNGQERIVNVRVTTDRRADGSGQDRVVTLDDITDLVTAQRTSAWADVARRIAHEIKNPLTPIQLSAERIRRRYGKRIEDDRAVFDQCVDTIIRQVGDIGRMVDEFSSFARMPKPVFEPGDLGEAVREALFLQSVSHPDVQFVSRLPSDAVIGRFDRRLIGQAVANVVKNAVEAVLAVPADVRGPGRVEVSVHRTGDDLVIDVVDNGIGLPKDGRERLLEPYMTTREKGTGLGLAIVGKIVEEHGGRIELLDSPAVATGGRGACVRLVIRADGNGPVLPSATPEATSGPPIVAARADVRPLEVLGSAAATPSSAPSSESIRSTHGD